MIKVGTIGSGFIVDAFFDAVERNEGIEVVAVYSRTKERAEEFAQSHHVEKYYWDLEEFLQDEEMNFVYVASPNSLHFSQTKAALLHGKNVITEKPFVPTYAEAMELYDIAREKGLYLFEAITVIHYPNYQRIREQIGKLGKICMVQANFSQYSSRMDRLINGEVTNAFSPAFAGGALADINIYNLHFVCGLFGFPKEVTYFANKWENGIDVSGILVLHYDDFYCSLVGAKDSASKPIVQIQGQKGYLTVHSQSSVLSDFEVVLLKERSIQKFNEQEAVHGLYYEIRDFVQVFASENHEQCLEWLKYTAEVVKVYEAARNSAGITFTN